MGCNVRTYTHIGNEIIIAMRVCICVCMLLSDVMYCDKMSSTVVIGINTSITL